MKLTRQPPLFAIALITMLGLSGCTSLTETGEKVTHTTDRAQVQKCKALGKVVATPPYSLPSDWKKKLRNAAAELGANWVVGDTDGLKSNVEGEAFRCP